MSVYFIRAEGRGPIKIGVTADVPARLREFQIGCPYPLTAIAVIDGGAFVTERALHRLFASGRLHGEWFDPDTPGLLELIADVLSDNAPEWIEQLVRDDQEPADYRWWMEAEPA